jgi:hypothetical protein
MENIFEFCAIYMYFVTINENNVDLKAGEKWKRPP